MRKIIVAATQMSCSWNLEQNLNKAEQLVRKAASQGAQVILLQELFETPYFCQQEKYEYLELAATIEENPAIRHFRSIAKELAVVLPISFFERAGNTNFNSVALMDADGSLLGVYRKSHIPDGHSYEEKFYFSPGDTGFKVWSTRYGRIGVGICWDQWFPETARCMALMGAEILLYPTAIGSEPVLHIDSSKHWQRCIQGHAASNLLPIVVSNRVGTEADETKMTFYGSSFITDSLGAIICQADRTQETLLTAEFDLDELQEQRRKWGIFRDRRPELYEAVMTLDSSQNLQSEQNC